MAVGTLPSATIPKHHPTLVLAALSTESSVPRSDNDAASSAWLPQALALCEFSYSYTNHCLGLRAADHFLMGNEGRLRSTSRPMALTVVVT